MSSTSEQRLEGGIGLARVLSQSVATMAPAASIVFGLGLVISYAGKAAPFSMFLGACAAFLIAICVGQLARHISSAGGIYSYAATALGDTAGFLVGWAYTFLFLTIICLVAISVGLTGGDFLDFYFHFTIPEWTLSIALIVLCAVLTYLGIRPSTTVTAVLAVAEVGLLLVVAFLLIGKAGADNSVSFFNPANAGFGSGSVIGTVFIGVVFAFSLISGFEAAAPLAEETKDPKRILPRAVMLAAAIIGVFYVITSYAAVVGWQGPLETFIESPNPWREMAGQVGGFFALLVVLAILNSQIAGEAAAFNVTSRLLFSMSRNGIFPHRISKVHPKYGSPHVAAVVTAALALVTTFAAKTIFDGAFPAYIFFLTTFTVIFLILYGMIAVATTVFYLTKKRDEFNPFLHLVVPLLSLVILAPTFYYSLRGLTHPASAAIPAVAIWVLIGLVVYGVLRMRGPDVTPESQRWLQQEG